MTSVDLHSVSVGAAATNSAYPPPAVYLPHQPPMLLLERIINLDQNSAHCQSSVDRHGVLAPFLTPQGHLPGWYTLELMAQTAGVWSGWHRQQFGSNSPPGLLLGGRDITCQYPEFSADSLLDIHVILIIDDGQFGSFEATIQCGQKLLAKGRINTLQPDQQALQQLFRRQPVNKESNKTDSK